jgi:hypothetical protein
VCQLASCGEGEGGLARQAEEFLDPFAGHLLDDCGESPRRGCATLRV